MTDRVIYVCLGLLALLALVAFFANPSYEKGVYITMTAVSNALSAALGAKFGLMKPGKD